MLVLDEPLNGLDPMARAEMIALFQELAADGRHLIISSHILHEVDLISDQVILLNEGYVVAEGDIRGVRGEMEEHPIQVLIRCDKPSLLAARVFEQDSVVEARLHDDRRGSAGPHPRRRPLLRLSERRRARRTRCEIEAVTVADADVHAVYQYLIGDEGESAMSPRRRSRVANRPRTGGRGRARVDWGLIGRQIPGILRLELRRNLFCRRALALYFLAFAPVALLLFGPSPRRPSTSTSLARGRGADVRRPLRGLPAHLDLPFAR